jgi:hypothetical protein
MAYLMFVKAGHEKACRKPASLQMPVIAKTWKNSEKKYMTKSP